MRCLRKHMVVHGFDRFFWVSPEGSRSSWTVSFLIFPYPDGSTILLRNGFSGRYAPVGSTASFFFVLGLQGFVLLERALYSDASITILWKRKQKKIRNICHICIDYSVFGICLLHNLSYALRDKASSSPFLRFLRIFFSHFFFFFGGGGGGSFIFFNQNIFYFPLHLATY